MHARLALLLGSTLSLVAAVHCARGSKPPGSSDAPGVSTQSAVADGGGEGGAAGASDGRGERHHHHRRHRRRRPDQALVQKALDRTGTPTSGDEQAHGLRLEVVEVGPHESWGLAVVNRGSETMTVVFDPRLLTLEVQAPPDPKAKRPVKPSVCRLPDELRPARADFTYVLELEPGHGMVEAIDPRLYCVPHLGVSPLVAGAKVSAKLGWAPKTKTVWQRGRKIEEALPQTSPFVALLAPKAPASPEDGGTPEDSPDEAVDEDAEARDSSGVTMTDTDRDDVVVGVKELYGTPFELGADYAPPPAPNTHGLALTLVDGSDAATEVKATVTVRLSNHGSVAEQVYFRRELMTFEVTSPDGSELCEPGPDDRAPDRQAFTSLAPGGSITVTSRLAELCPRDTFARPGLYLVRGAFDADISGSEFGFDAFVGHLNAEKPVPVRIRSGHLPFPGARALQEVQVGGAPPGPKSP